MATHLVDRYLHTPQVVEAHSVDIDAPLDRIWTAVDTVGMNDVPVVQFLMRVRILLSRAFGGTMEMTSGGPAMVCLDRTDTEVVHGLIGRWWAIGDETRRTDIDTVDEFLAFAEPGWAKATFSFRTEELPDGRIRLHTETRVRTTDEQSLRAMRRYWTVIGPFSGLVRRLLLRAIARKAQGQSPISSGNSDAP